MRTLAFPPPPLATASSARAYARFPRAFPIGRDLIWSWAKGGQGRAARQGGCRCRIPWWRRSISGANCSFLLKAKIATQRAESKVMIFLKQGRDGSLPLKHFFLSYENKEVAAATIERSMSLVKCGIDDISGFFGLYYYIYTVDRCAPDCEQVYFSYLPKFHHEYPFSTLFITAADCPFC